MQTQTITEPKFESALLPRAEELDEEAGTPGAYAQETLWENPTDKDVVLDLHVGSRATPGKVPSRIEQTGIRRFRIRAHTVGAIPNEFDMAIQHTQCHEHECASRPMHCRKNGHRKQIVGGYGIQLINRGEQKRPVLHPSLDDQRASYEQKQARVQDAELARMKAEEATRLAHEELNRLNEEIAAARTQAVASAVAQVSEGRSFVAPPNKKSG